MLDYVFHRQYELYLCLLTSVLKIAVNKEKREKRRSVRGFAAITMTFFNIFLLEMFNIFSVFHFESKCQNHYVCSYILHNAPTFFYNRFSYANIITEL